MATKTETTRRSILKAAAIAAGAAALPARAAGETPPLQLGAPTITPAQALEVLRLDYQRKVEAIARRLVGVDPHPEMAGVHPDDVPCQVGNRFEEEVALPTVAPTLEEARLAHFLSPHAEAAGDFFSYDDPRLAAATAATMDAAKLCGAAWYLALYHEEG